MVDSVASVSSASLAVSGQRTLSSVFRSRLGTSVLQQRETAAPVGISPAAGTDNLVSLNHANSNTLVRDAAYAATGIVEALNFLKSAVELAGKTALVRTETSLITGGSYETRVSALNIQAQARILLKRIDRLVDASAIGNANLLSSRSSALRLQTTQFGGHITVAPQPLDSAGLGLENLSLISNGGTDDALARVELAIVNAGQRFERIESLQRLIGGATVSSQLLARVSSGFGTSSLPLGTFVDVVG